MKLFNKLSGSGFIWLMGILGAATLAEGLRLNQKLDARSWLEEAGTYLIVIGGALVLLACLDLIRWLKSRKNQPATSDEKADLAAWFKKNQRVLITMASIAVYILIIPYLGMALATIPFLLGVMLVMKNSKKAMIITIIIAFLFAFWMLPAMGISLPRGHLLVF